MLPALLGLRALAGRGMLWSLREKAPAHFHGWLALVSPSIWCCLLSAEIPPHFSCHDISSWFSLLSCPHSHLFCPILSCLWHFSWKEKGLRCLVGHSGPIKPSFRRTVASLRSPAGSLLMLVSAAGDPGGPSQPPPLQCSPRLHTIPHVGLRGLHLRPLCPRRAGEPPARLPYCAAIGHWGLSAFSRLPTSERAGIIHPLSLPHDRQSQELHAVGAHFVECQLPPR